MLYSELWGKGILVACRCSLFALHAAQSPSAVLGLLQQAGFSQLALAVAGEQMRVGGVPVGRAGRGLGCTD